MRNIPSRPRQGARALARPAPVVAAIAAAAAALASLLSAPAHAAPGPLQVDFVANGGHYACAAQDVAFQKTTTMQVSWRCAGSVTRFRCDMTAAGVFATDVNLVALNCNRLTELPPTFPATLIHASGFESA
ncbi:MAG TPA: hypothetical protein VFL14_02945 [Xanthomonadales bacterium]|nr:hypothetical protein [Xanthomonadales bacterium]